MHLWIVPAVTGIRLICIIENKPALMKKSKALRGLAVMFVCFGWTVGEIILAMIYTKRKRQFDQILFGKYLFYFSAKCFIDPIIVIGIDEAAVLKIHPEALYFESAERHVAMPAEKNKWIGKEAIAGDIDKFIHRVDINESVLPDEFEEVDFFLRIVVPIAAAAVLEPRDLERAADFCRLRKCSRRKENTQKNEDRDALLHTKRYEISQEEARRVFGGNSFTSNQDYAAILSLVLILKD